MFVVKSGLLFFNRILHSDSANTTGFLCRRLWDLQRDLAGGGTLRSGDAVNKTSEIRPRGISSTEQLLSQLTCAAAVALDLRAPYLN